MFIPSPKTVTLASFFVVAAALCVVGCDKTESATAAAPPATMPAMADGKAQAETGDGSQWLGKTVTPFTLTDSDGKTVNLADSLGKEPVVLVFYRGSWCPFCAAQLKELAAAKEKIAASGAKVYAISNEGAAELNKMKSGTNLDFATFLSDPEAKAAQQFGGTYPDKPVLKPVTLVIGKNGKVVYAYTNENYEVRATTDAVLNALAKAK
ncbi:MAG: AhpC/TSA family protein [Armatimonadetes bacterium]|nr:AhpC/TSA family protein [Armatimonadota bacterium]